MKQIRRLTLEEMVGQLFFLGFQGPAPDHETWALIEAVRPSGFVFFQRNIENFDQFSALTTRLREPNGLPAFLGIDHEGGQVDRLKQIFNPIPAMGQLAELGTSYLRAGARIIASELEAMGLNLDFAPVLDLKYPQSVMVERVLADNPALAARLGVAFVDELSKKNILSCIKHFPGMGAADRDPHFVLPRIDKSKRHLQQEDVVPFLNLLDEVGMVMVSHVYYPAMGDDRPTPASLSSRVVESYLRKKLGFSGVIITDDLTMGAISSFGLTPEIFLRAFEAGNDMLLFSQTTPLVEEAFKLIVRTVRQSDALRKRLEQSVSRILLLKTKIQYLPLRYRAHVRARINRQIEKLRQEIVSESVAL
jgi:beta-N-acetylhexosaminidase